VLFPQRWNVTGNSFEFQHLESAADICIQNSLEEISLSYNGGKDCLVLLILLLASLSTHPANKLPPALQTVYIISPHPFTEVDEFVQDSISSYSLDLARYTLPMKEAFRVYLEEHKSVKAILVGTRRTDPHGATLTHFDGTDHGWPAFMRVHPVIDWHYAEIWAVCAQNLPFQSGVYADNWPNSSFARSKSPTAFYTTAATHH
jgi:3'-phosphoadenosine 5'-phosphosulfate sulfotransferase (PAPS reductase)/FAD synthetase